MTPFDSVTGELVITRACTCSAWASVPKPASAASSDKVVAVRAVVLFMSDLLDSRGAGRPKSVGGARASGVPTLYKAWLSHWVASNPVVTSRPDPQLTTGRLI